MYSTSSQSGCIFFSQFANEKWKVLFVKCRVEKKEVEEPSRIDLLPKAFLDNHFAPLLRNVQMQNEESSQLLSHNDTNEITEYITVA